MKACPTKYGLYKTLEEKLGRELTDEERGGIDVLYDDTIAMKTDELVRSEAAIGDAAMKGYGNRDITQEVVAGLGSKVTMRINGSAATMTRTIRKAYDRLGTIVIAFTNDAIYTFNKGQDRSHDNEDTTHKVKYVVLEGLGKIVNSIPKLSANVKTDNVFSAVEKTKFANPLVKALMKETKATIKEADVSAIQLIGAIRQNVVNIAINKNTVLTSNMIDSMYVNGQYKMETNTILHPGKLNTVEVDLQKALDTSVKELEKDDKDLAELVRTKIEPEWTSAVHRAVHNRVQDLKTNGNRIPIETLLHELGHAVVMPYVHNNPESSLVLELSAIYENVKPLLMKDRHLATVDTYWQTDLEEFISEAISNPKLIKSLAKIKVDNVRDVNNILQAIVKAIAGLFGTAKTTMYDAIMFRVAQIAEEQDMQQSAKLLRSAGTSMTDVELGSKKATRNWDGLVKDKDYLHGDKESMLEMLKTLHEMGGKKASDEDFAYYQRLLGAMDEKFFTKMSLFIKKTSQESGGLVTGKAINFAISKSAMLAGNQQTEAEIYLHEIVHTMTKFARLSNTVEARAIERELEFAMKAMREKTTWKSFLPEVSIDEKLEEANAKEMYEYIFNSKNAMDEFIAHVLTNPQVKKVAQKIKITRPEKIKTVFESAMSMFHTLVDVVLGNYSFKEKDNNVYDQVFNLSMQLGEINNRAVAAKKDSEDVFSATNGLINAVDAKIARKLNDLQKKWMTDDGSRIGEYPSTGSRLAKGKWLFALLKKALVNEEYGKTLGLFASAYGIKPDGLLRNVLGDLSEPSAFEKSVEWLQLESDKTEGARNDIKNAAKKQINDGFKRKLTDAESRALLRTIVDLDMSILMQDEGKEAYDNHYTAPELRRLLTDVEYLKTQIGRAKRRLELAGGTEYYNWYTNQATGLGYFLATGKANLAQNFNAVNIARGLISTHYHKPVGKVIVEVNLIATLVGIQNTGQHERLIAANLLKEEKVGVLNLMKTHRGYEKEALKTLFKGNSTQMIKGYSRELFDDTLDVRIAPISEKEEMDAAGFTFRGELPGKYGTKTDQPMGIFISKSFGVNERMRGATRLIGSGSRGTTITETKYADGGDFAAERAARDIAKLDVERLKLVQKQLRGEFDKDDTEYGLSPVLSADGNVVNYRYMMDKRTKEELLKQDTSVSEVIGRTFGAMVDKDKSKEHNKKVLASILDNMKENWSGGLLGKDLVTEYTLIGPDIAGDKAKELYRILPYEFQEAIKNRKDRMIAVPTSLMPMYFGYTHLSIVDFPGFKTLMPKAVVELTRLLEAMWIELVKISKTNLLLKVPSVLAGNLKDNFIQSVNMGLGLATSVRLHKESFADVRAYLKKKREVSKLEMLVASGQATRNIRDRILVLKTEMANNPSHEVFDKGMYLAFQEDVENAETRSTNKIKKRLDEVTNKFPSFIKTPLQWIYLSDETAYYKTMQEILQTSDFIFRDVMNRFYKEQEQKQANGKVALPVWYLEKEGGDDKQILTGDKKKAFLKEARERNLYIILQMAVNYNKPPSNMEAFLNRIGPIQFSAFTKRIQLVAKNTVVEHPVRSALVMAANSIIPGFGGIQEQMLVLGKTVPIYGPLDVIQRAVTPGAIQLIEDVS